MISTKPIDCGPWKYEHRCDKGHHVTLTASETPRCISCEEQQASEMNRLRAENVKLRAVAEAAKRVRSERALFLASMTSACPSRSRALELAEAQLDAGLDALDKDML
jgi:hypothetical protein